MRYVLKFGGTSLETVKKIKEVARFIKNRWSKNQLVVVVSAMGKTTNQLEMLAAEFKNPSPTAHAALITTGENISAALLALALESLNIKTKILTAKETEILTRGSKLNAVITSVNKSVIEKHLASSVIIVPGFQGIDESGDLTSLGRGGSDTTAVMLASVLSCKAYIFTDVDGYYVCDPNFQKTRRLKKVNIFSALEGANNSAKVLDRRCLEIANQHKTEVEVLKSQKTSGTPITYSCPEGFAIDSISFKTDLSFVKYAYKKTNNLQLCIKKRNICPLFEEVFAEVNTYFCLLETKNVGDFCKSRLVFAKKDVEQVILTGSGLNFHRDFIEKVQKTIKTAKIHVVFYALHPTFLKIVTEANEAKRLTRLLVKNLAL